MFKLFQYDKKVWDTGEVDYTYQFGIINNRTLLWVHYDAPGGIIHSSGGINILFSLFGSSLMSVSFQQRKFGLGFDFFAEYFEGWNE